MVRFTFEVCPIHRPRGTKFLFKVVQFTVDGDPVYRPLWFTLPSKYGRITVKWTMILDGALSTLGDDLDYVGRWTNLVKGGSVIVQIPRHVMLRV